MASQSKTPETPELAFFPLGTGEKPYGVQAAVDPDNEVIHLTIAYGAEAVKNAPLSSTKKTKLVGSTGGRCQVPGSPIAVNVLAMIPNKPEADAS